MDAKIIKVGFCVAYDWEMLKTSIPRIYNDADVICLSIDKKRKTWKGEPYTFDEVSFRNFIMAVDTEKKIDVYEDDFSLSHLTSMQNDTRQRQLMADRLGKGGWHIQIDSDEHILNFANCVQKLKNINSYPTGDEKPLNICAFIIPLIKKLTNGFLIVDFKDESPETLPLATTRPQYLRARNSGHFNKYISEFVIHETWARSEEELWLKINNWGHSSEELDYEKKRLSYYHLWKSLDEFNHQYIFNFHPAIAKTWPALKYVTATNTKELLDNFIEPKLPFNQLQLWVKNNRNFARLNSYSKKLSNGIIVKKISH
jgi:hypothetical protein